MPKRVDANQAEIVAALRAAGCSVQDLHSVGHGCPDLLVGRALGEYVFHDGVATANYLLEVKTSTGKLNTREAVWHRDWRGQVAVVRSVEEALELVGVLR